MNSMYKVVPVALLSSLALLAGPAFAADEYPTNPEKSFVLQAPALKRTRSEVRAELDDFRGNPVTADGWQVVGGERGEALLQHKYEYQNGRFVATVAPDYAGQNASATWSPEELKMAALNYRNAP